MKKFTYIYICLLGLIGLQAQAQSYNYTDLGIFFSKDNYIGTARFTGLNGSMGAVGGDLSSININPAGIAVYNNNEVNITLASYSFKNDASYYGNTISNNSNSFNTDQLGGVFVFKDAVTTNSWSKISFAINYQKTAEFNSQNSFFGNSEFSTFITHPNDDEDYLYENAISQDFYSNIEGKASKINFALAGQYGKNLYAGFSLNFHHIDYTQNTSLNELSEDEDGNVLDFLANENNYHNASGFSVNLGFIYKPIHNIRLGASYQSPTWYNMEEDYSEEEFFANIPNRNVNAADPYRGNSYFDYKYNTASNLTLSGALVVGKLGFINIDYKYKIYNTLSTKTSDNVNGLNYTNPQEIIDGFRADNQYFSNVLQNTHNVNIGGEFRYNNFSFRAGLGYQQSPFKDDLDPRDTDILKLGEMYSGSLGIGARFGASRLDLAYRRTTQENEYDFNDANQEFEYIKSGMIDNKNSRIVATYTYSF